MAKGLGYCLIALSCWALGESAVGRLREHRRRLKRMQSWLSCFRGKLLFEGATVEEALRESAQLAGAPFSLLFGLVADALCRRDGMSLAAIWEAEAEKYKHQLMLSEEEYGDLIRFGGLLGQMDREAQQRAVVTYDERLAAAVKAAEEEIAVKEKLYRSLGIMSGCFIIILIW